MKAFYIPPDSCGSVNTRLFYFTMYPNACTTDACLPILTLNFESQSSIKIPECQSVKGNQSLRRRLLATPNLHAPLLSEQWSSEELHSFFQRNAECGLHSWLLLQREWPRDFILVTRRTYGCSVETSRTSLQVQLYLLSFLLHLPPSFCHMDDS